MAVATTTALALGAAAASTAAGVASARKGRKAAEAQGRANRRAADKTRDAEQERFEQVQEFLQDVSFQRTNPMDFKNRGVELSELATNFARDVLGQNRTAVIGEENLGAFDALKSRLLDESQFNFSPELSRRIDGSALSRTAGTGVAGAAERLATDQRFAFGRASRNDLLQTLNFESRFQPQPVNPVDNIFKLAEFEFRQNQFDTTTQLNKAGAQVDNVNTNFQTEAAFLESQAANDPSSIALRGQANELASLAQGISNLSGTVQRLDATQSRIDSQNQTTALLNQTINDRRSSLNQDPLNFEFGTRGFMEARPVSLFASQLNA